MLFSAMEDAHLIQYKVPGTPGYLQEEVDTSFMDAVFEFTGVLS